jgi:hypothetical protein
MNTLSIPSDPSVGAFGWRADSLVRRSLSRLAFSTDYKYAYVGYTYERLRRVLGLEQLATTFMNHLG